MANKTGTKKASVAAMPAMTIAASLARAYGNQTTDRHNIDQTALAGIGLCISKCMTHTLAL